MCKRLRVRIPARRIGKTFSTLLQICLFCLKRPRMNEKESEDGPFFTTKVGIISHWTVRFWPMKPFFCLLLCLHGM